MIHIYCGNGKGKTTAAAGLAVRALGAGLEPAFFQFLKNGSSSEIKVLRDAGMPVRCCEACTKFTFRMNSEEKDEVRKCHNRMLQEAAAYAAEHSSAVVVLDEFLDAYKSELLDRNAAEKLVLDFPEGCELVLTGRNPAEIFVSAADYISEINALKHPYSRGVTARKGIEY